MKKASTLVSSKGILEAEKTLSTFGNSRMSEVITSGITSLIKPPPLPLAPSVWSTFVWLCGPHKHEKALNLRSESVMFIETWGLPQ